MMNCSSPQILVKFCLFILKILSENRILTSIMGSDSATNLQKLTPYIPNLGLVNVYVYTKFGQILPICSEDIKWRRNSYINQGP